MASNLRTLAETLRREHERCNRCPCPEECGCAPCDCGADAHNAQLDALLAAIDKASPPPAVTAAAEEVLRLAGEASPAPWDAVCLNDYTDSTYIDGPQFSYSGVCDDALDGTGIAPETQAQVHRNAAFIAATRTLAVVLAEWVDRARRGTP